jgi:hypothetical protein
MKVMLITFCMLAILFLSADNKRIEKELKERLENPDE